MLIGIIQTILSGLGGSQTNGTSAASSAAATSPTASGDATSQAVSDSIAAAAAAYGADLPEESDDGTYSPTLASGTPSNENAAVAADNTVPPDVAASPAPGPAATADAAVATVANKGGASNPAETYTSLSLSSQRRPARGSAEPGEDAPAAADTTRQRQRALEAVQSRLLLGLLDKVVAADPHDAEAVLDSERRTGGRDTEIAVPA